MLLKPGAVLIILIGLMGMLGAVTGCSSLPNDAAAQVNDTVITKEDVAKRIDNLRKVYSTMIPIEDDEEAFSNFRREVADQLVREELEKQEAEKRGISISDAEVDQRLEELAEEKYLGDTSKVIEEYQSKGLTPEDMRQDIARTLLHEKMEAEIGKDIHVSDQDALEYYERNKSQFVQPERRQVRQIVTDNEAAARDAANRARGGEDFLQLVEGISIDPNAATKKGALGLVSPGQLPPELDQAVFRMAENEISDPINVGQQWYVLRLEYIVSPVNVSFEDAKQDIIALYGGQLYAQRWREFVQEVYDNSSIEFDEDYDPQFKVDTTSTVPAQP